MGPPTSWSSSRPAARPGFGGSTRAGDQTGERRVNRPSLRGRSTSEASRADHGAREGPGRTARASALGAALGVLGAALVLHREPGRAHVGLGADAHTHGELLVVDVEDDPLALPEHAEHRAL